jgi:hypothetical protein
MQVQERTADLAQANEALRVEIAERKRVEEALRESEAQLKILFEYVWTICAISPLHSLPFRSFLSTIRAVKVIGVCLLCRLHQTARTLTPRLVLRRGGQGSQGRSDRPYSDQALRSPGGFPGKIGRTGGQLGGKASQASRECHQRARRHPKGNRSLQSRTRSGLRRSFTDSPYTLSPSFA